MFGRKKKEEEAKRLAEQQPVEPLEKEYLDSEILSDSEIEIASFGGEEPAVSPVQSAPAEDFSDFGTEAAELQEEDFPVIEDFPEIEEIPAEEVIEAPVEEAVEEAEEAPAEETEEEPVPEEAAEEIPEETEEEAAAEEEQAEETQEDEAAEEEPEEDSEEAEETQPEAPETQEEVVYVVDGPEEDDEIVKASQFVKLPHLVDYLLSSEPKPSKKYLLQYAMKLSELYPKARTPEDKKIVKSCILKIANAMR